MKEVRFILPVNDKKIYNVEWEIIDFNSAVSEKQEADSDNSICKEGQF